MQTSTDICNAEKPINHEFFFTVKDFQMHGYEEA